MAGSTVDKLINITINADEAISGITKITKEVDTLNGKIKELNKNTVEVQNGNTTTTTKKSNDQLEADRKEAAKLTEQVKALNKEKTALSKAVQDEIKSNVHNKDSVVKLRAELSKLIADYDRLSATERKSANGQLMKKQIQELTKAVKEAETATGRFGRNVGNYTSAFKGLWKTVGVQLIGGFLGTAQAVVALGSAFRSAIQTSSDFNRSVSKLQAILLGTQGDMDILVAKAKELGYSTRYTAQEVVNLEVELAKLGYRQNQITQMANSVLLLAQATGATLPEAAALAGSTLRMFGKDADSTAEVVDKLALATTSSALSFDYIKTALPIVGSTARTFGFELEEVLALVGTLANNGMEASMAATATRNIILRLADANGDLAKQLGKPVKNIHDLVEGLKDLRNRGVDLNDALQLTDKRSVNAFSALLRSANGVEKLSDEIGKANGTAKEMADIMEDNLTGDITRLSSAWQDLELSIGGSQGTLRKATQYLREYVVALADYMRSKQESMKIDENQQVEELSEEGNLLDQYKKQDLEEYKKRIKEYLSQGLSPVDAETSAFNDIINNIEEDTEILGASKGKLEETLKKFEAEIPTYQNESNEYIKRVLAKGKDVLNSEIAKTNPFAAIFDYLFGGLNDEEKQALTNLLAQRELIDNLNAKIRIQDSRKQNFINYAAEEPEATGIPIEDSTARTSRLNLEKQIAKAELEARKRRDKEDLTNDKDSYEKRRKQINNAMDNEIATIKYKLDEEIRVLEEKAAMVPNLSEEYKQRLKNAREYYNQTAIYQQNLIEETRKMKLTILDEQWNQKVLKDAQNLMNQQLESVKKNSAEEFAIRQNLLVNQQAIELSALNQLSAEEEMTEEEKEKRILAINEKYAKKRISLKEQERDANISANIASLSANEVRAGRVSGVASAKASLATAEKKQSTLYQKSDETDEAYDLRKEQAKQEVLNKTAELTKAQISANTLEAQLAVENSRTEIDALRATAEFKRKTLEENLAAGKLANETEEEWLLRRAQLEKDSADADRSYADAQFEMWSNTASSIATSFGTISQAIEDCGEENEKNVKRAKILGLAEVYIQQAVAIATAIKDASQSSITVWDLIANIATAVTTVVSTTAQAISSIKKAKFAKGAVDIQGPGTSTSDSIPAQLSKGESVMTARATDLFKPLLAIMNEIASQPNVTLPNVYSRYNSAQSNADNETIARGMREAVEDIHPVVSVREINDVNTRYNRVQALDNI